MMDRAASGYDMIAPFYDDIAGLVFGKPLLDAQLYFLPQIQDGSEVLILGGGTGWFLPELFRLKPHLKVYYLDASPKMISIAEKRKRSTWNIDFICGTTEMIPDHLQFDSIILNFFVDGFTKDQLPLFLRSINVHLKPGARWLVTDFFETSKPRHQFILWLTHLFFRILIHHPNHRLVPWWKTFEESGFTIIHERSWSNGLIKSIIYSGS